MHQIFVSYRHDDEVDLLDLLIIRLEQANYKVWTDRNLKAAEVWTEEIDNAIKDSSAVIVIMTEAAHQSPYVTYEWSYALGVGKPIMVMMVSDKVDLHPRLKEYQYADFTAKSKRPWEKILAGLEEIVRDLQETRQEQAFRWMQDGDSELEQDDIVSALDSYTNAYNLADDRLRVRIGYKIARLHIRQIEKTSDKDKKAALLDKIESLLSDALKVRPNYDAARAYLGYCYRLKRDVVSGEAQRLEVLNLARTHLKEALSNQPDLIDHNGESWWNTYGGVLRRLGDMLKKDDPEAANENFDQAIDAYQKATQYGKKSSYPYGNLAVLYMLRGDTGKMVSNYTRVGYYPPSDASDFWGHGDQLVANLIKNEAEKVESEYMLYDAFAPAYARTTLLETLQSIAKILGAKQAEPLKQFIGRLLETMDSQQTA
jgi:hypothetical protein